METAGVIWGWLKTWEIREWITLAFAAAAAAAPWFIHRSNSRKAIAAADRLWSIRLQPWLTVESGFRMAELRLENYRDNRFLLASLTAAAPRGALVSGFKSGRAPDGSTASYSPTNPSRSWSIERELAGGFSIRAPHPDYSSFSFLLKMPPRPWYCRSSTTRALIDVTVEEVSSSRRRRRIHIRTQPIEWTAKRPASTT